MRKESALFIIKNILVSLINMKKVILISIIIFSWGQLFSQDYPTIKNLKKLFSEKQEQLGELAWKTCNDDSTYYKNHTINLFYRNTTCLGIGKCCKEIEWTFVNRKSFGLTNTLLCQEPPLSTPIGFDDRYKMKIKKVGSILELSIKNSKNQTEVFKVISLTKCEGDYTAYGKYGYELLLERIKTAPSQHNI